MPVLRRSEAVPSDPFQAATLVTHEGQVVHEATWQRILDSIQLAGTP